MTIRRRLRSILWRVPVEDEVRDELTHHRELRIEELVDRGWEREAARAEVSRRLDGVAATLARLGEQRNRADAWREAGAEAVSDVRFALRQCRVHPAFTAAAVLTLAVGIGSTTGIFSVVHAVLLRPLPIPDPDRVLHVYTSIDDQLSNTSVGNFTYIRERASSFESLAAVQYTSVNLADAGAPERVLGARVTWEFFPVFGLPPLHGRVFAADEDAPGRGHVVVLSHRLWTRRFGADRALIGRDVRLNGEPYRVIGVMPPAFDRLVENDELWIPAAFTLERLAMFDEHFLELFGRRRSDVSLARVNAELQAIAAGLRVDHPQENVHRGAVAQLLSASTVGAYRTRLGVLLAATGLVLLVACTNVANLILARVGGRTQELAVRAALGAGRGRLVRQLLTESFVLSALGGLAGLIAAAWALPVLIAAAPDGVPRLAEARLDGAVLVATVLLVLLSALLAGALPAWYVTRRPARPTGSAKGATTSAVRPRVRQALIAGQVALVFVVLAGAMLLARSAIKLAAVPLGFDGPQLLLARLTLPASTYPPAQMQASLARLVEDLTTRPGVALAALDSQAPLTETGGQNGLIPEGRPYRAESVIISRLHVVTPDYFRTIGLPILAGRALSAQDVRDGQLVMVVNETLAREAWPGQDPLGKRMGCCEGSPDEPRWKVVVGVVPDVRVRGPGMPAGPQFYLPMAQVPPVAWSWLQNTMNIVVRPRSGPPSALAGSIRGAVAALDPTVAVYGMSTIDERLGAVLAQSRFNAQLMGALAGTGLALAALGIYSVIAWLVTERAREIGVRMALGASPGSLVRGVVGQGLRPVLAGMAVGVAGALATTRLLADQLFEVGPRDPLALTLVGAGLLAVAGLAAFLPARRATAVAPSIALRDG